MSRSSPSRSARKADNADVSYEIATPFQSTNTTIHLFAKDDDSVEVLIARIPVPKHYHDNHKDQSAVARWIIDDVGSELRNWEYRTSSHKSNNAHYYLRDIYFECNRSEVNEAVIAAKRFLTKLEEKVVRQRQNVENNLSRSPLNDLPG